TAAASSSIGFMTPVEVSLCVRSTAFHGPPARRASTTAVASAAWPHGTSSLVTSAPYVEAIFANRSPNEPMLTPRTLSPGESVLTIAASSPPVPALERSTMSFAVPKNVRSPPTIRSCIAANSGPRWLIIWRAPASRTADGRDVGPGIRRFVSKRFTAGLQERQSRGGASIVGAAPPWPPRLAFRALEEAVQVPSENSHKQVGQAATVLPARDDERRQPAGEQSVDDPDDRVHAASLARRPRRSRPGCAPLRPRSLAARVAPFGLGETLPVLLTGPQDVARGAHPVDLRRRVAGATCTTRGSSGLARLAAGGHPGRDRALVALLDRQVVLALPELLGE